MYQSHNQHNRIVIMVQSDRYSSWWSQHAYRFYPTFPLIKYIRACNKAVEQAQQLNFHHTSLKNLRLCVTELKDKVGELRGSWEGYNHMHVGSTYDIIECNRFVHDMEYRFDKALASCLKETRRCKAILGDFSDSIKPSLVHAVLSWLKKTDPAKYTSVRRRTKELIVNDLKELGLEVNANLLSEFIEQVDPTRHLREWNVSLYHQGRRQKNTVLRKLLAEEFHRRERNYLRNAYTSPCIRGLPEHVEKHIMSFV